MRTYKLSGDKYKRWQNNLLLVLLLGSIIDSIIMKYTNRTYIVSIQYGINIIFLLLFFVRINRFEKCSVYKFIFIITIYFLFLGLFSSNYTMTYNYLAKFLIPFFFFIVGYNMIRSAEEYLVFAKKSIVLLVYFVGYVVYANVFSIGDSFYGGKSASFMTGYMGLQSMYISTFLIIQSFFLWPFYKKKTFIILLASFGIIIFLLILKRTNIILLGIGLILWLYYEKKISSIYGWMFLIVLAISLYYVSSSQLFKERISERESRFSSEYSVKQEGRFKENYFVWERVSDSPLHLLFGTGEVFNDVKFMSAEADFIDRKLGRQIHNSYASLLWSGGILGIFLFLWLYIQFWKKVKLYYKKTNSSILFKTLYHLAMVYIIIHLINDMSAGIYYLTFNSFFYFTMGALLRVGYNKWEKNRVIN